MNLRWQQRIRGNPSRTRFVILDALVDENGDYLVDERGVALESGHATTTKALRDENGRLLVDETGSVLITE